MRSSGWWKNPDSARLRAESSGLVLLALALIVNAILLWPEIRIERVPVNDLSFHIATSQHLANGLITGDSFLDRRYPDGRWGIRYGTSINPSRTWWRDCG